MINGATKILGTDRAAGLELTETVPAGAAWGLIAVSVALVQGATQTPQPALVIDDGTDIFFVSPGSSAAQAAATTCRYTWSQDVGISGQIGATPNINSVGPLPTGFHRIPLLPGYRVRTVTAGIGANTDYGAPVLWVTNYGS